jgi:hypothetical protein
MAKASNNPSFFVIVVKGMIQGEEFLAAFPTVAYHSRPRAHVRSVWATGAGDQQRRWLGLPRETGKESARAAAGETRAELAADLGIAISTVAAHVSGCYPLPGKRPIPPKLRAEILRLVRLGETKVRIGAALDVAVWDVHRAVAEAQQEKSVGGGGHDGVTSFG